MLSRVEHEKGFITSGPGFFLPTLMTDIGSSSQWQKVCFFPNFKENSQFKEHKKISPFCDILTELFHSKLYF